MDSSDIKNEFRKLTEYTSNVRVRRKARDNHTCVVTSKTSLAYLEVKKLYVDEIKCNEYVKYINFDLVLNTPFKIENHTTNIRVVCMYTFKKITFCCD